MKLGRVHFEHFDEEDIEAVYSTARALERDCRGMGCYGLSNLLRKLVTEIVVELSVREVDRARMTDDQLRLDT